MKLSRFVPAFAGMLFALMLLTPLAASAQFERGEKCVGAKLGYVDKNNSASMGLVFQYSFSRHLRVAPEIGCVFKHKNMDAFTIDFNFHTPFTFTGEKAALYPLAGLNYSSWNRHDLDFDTETDDVSTRVSRFGVNFGAGVELRPTSTLKIKAELKYNLIKSYSGYYVSVGIGYIF